MSTSNRVRVTLNKGTHLTEYLLSFKTNKERSYELLRLAERAFHAQEGGLDNHNALPLRSLKDATARTAAHQPQSEPLNSNGDSARTADELSQIDEEKHPHSDTPHDEEGSPVDLGGALDLYLD
jgi:hypothetical protein